MVVKDSRVQVNGRVLRSFVEIYLIVSRVSDVVIFKNGVMHSREGKNVRGVLVSRVLCANGLRLL